MQRGLTVLVFGNSVSLLENRMLLYLLKVVVGLRRKLQLACCLQFVEALHTLAIIDTP